MGQDAARRSQPAPSRLDRIRRKGDSRRGGRPADLALLAHGNGHNTSDKPRLAQYITMSPARTDDESARQARVASWQERRPMPNWPGDAREQEKQQTLS